MKCFSHSTDYYFWFVILYLIVFYSIRDEIPFFFFNSIFDYVTFPKLKTPLLVFTVFVSNSNKYKSVEKMIIKWKVKNIHLQSKRFIDTSPLLFLDIQQRFVLSFLGFIGVINSHLMRVSLSVEIITMTEPPVRPLFSGVEFTVSL